LSSFSSFSFSKSPSPNGFHMVGNRSVNEGELPLARESTTFLSSLFTAQQHVFKRTLSNGLDVSAVLPSQHYESLDSQQPQDHPPRW
jgi:hypothetical protein